MSTPPPTETPAPLSTQAQVQADIEVRLRMSLGWSKSRDALCEEAAIEIATLRARNEAHVAALQEIGRGVEEDQATIARLREAMKLIAQCLEGSKYKSNMEGRAYGDERHDER